LKFEAPTKTFPHFYRIAAVNTHAVNHKKAEAEFWKRSVRVAVSPKAAPAAAAAPSAERRVVSERQHKRPTLSLFRSCWSKSAPSKAAPRHPMATLRELQRQLADRLEELRRRDAVIEYLEREVAERDVLIRHLKNEIDKFQQVVGPLTQQLTRVHRSVLAAPPQRPVRTKRQAISAEPRGRPGDPGYEEPLPLEITHKPEA